MAANDCTALSWVRLQQPLGSLLKPPYRYPSQLPSIPTATSEPATGNCSRSRASDTSVQRCLRQGHWPCKLLHQHWFHDRVGFRHVQPFGVPDERRVRAPRVRSGYGDGRVSGQGCLPGIPHRRQRPGRDQWCHLQRGHRISEADSSNKRHGGQPNVPLGLAAQFSVASASNTVTLSQLIVRARAIPLVQGAANGRLPAPCQ
jgi:hypothetical protein